MSLDGTEASWKILELAATGSDSEIEIVLSAGPINLEVFTLGAIRHKLLPEISRIIEECGLGKYFPSSLRSTARMLRRATKFQADFFTKVAVGIQTATRARGVPVAWTKGVVLEHSLYSSLGTRMFADIDMMVSSMHRDEIRSILIEQGYIPGHRYDQKSLKLVPLPRRELVAYGLWPDHLPHFHKITRDSMVPLTTIDVAHSFTWHGSVWEVPLDAAFESVTEVALPSGRSIVGLAPDFSFLFVCLHLFREAWFERNFAARDVTLARLGEVVRYWRRLDPPDKQLVRSRIVELHLGQPLSWVIGHIDLLFETDLTSEIGLSSENVWLTTAMALDGTQRQWHGSMRARMRELNTVELN